MILCFKVCRLMLLIGFIAYFALFLADHIHLTLHLESNGVNCSWDSPTWSDIFESAGWSGLAMLISIVLADGLLTLYARRCPLILSWR